MAVMLYKPGDEKIVRGIPCVVGIFEIDEMEYRLLDGWSKSPEGSYDVDPSGDSNSDEVLTEMEKPEDVFEVVEESNLDKMDNNAIRQAAKDCGHAKWKTARIDKLKAYLKDVNS